MPAPGPYTTALVLIARDEAPRIGRLLASVQDWVDKLLVLDTGSKDATVAIARAAGAEVQHFPWCDDFAAARNAALAHAQADWHLVLDADEWLIEGGPWLATLRHEPPGFVGALRLDDFGSAEGVVHNRISRLLPGGVRYAGRVHEQPQHTLPVRAVPLVVGHDGYSTERLQAKQGRNRALLQAAVQVAPADAYLWYQLGKDCSVYGDHAAAAQAFARAMALAPTGLAPLMDWRLDLITRQLFSLKKTGCHADGLQLAETHLAACQHAPDFFFALGDLLLDWCAEDPRQGPTLLPLVLDAWQRCLALGEHPELPGAVAGRGSYLAAHNLAVVHEGLGDTARAAELRARYPRPATSNPEAGARADAGADAR